MNKSERGASGPAIRAVAFDVGNVLLDWVPEALVAPIAAVTGLPGDVAMRCVATLYARAKRRLDLGDLSPGEFHAELRDLVVEAGGRGIDYAEWLVAWCATIRERPGANALATRVRRDVAIGVWSNTDPVHFARYSSWLPVFARARSLWLSYVVGVAKPDRAFYEGAVAALGVRAEEVLFLDDIAANVEAAREIGVQAVEAATLAAVERELAARGLLRG